LDGLHPGGQPEGGVKIDVHEVYLTTEFIENKENNEVIRKEALQNLFFSVSSVSPWLS
jgi:hypothetical protein